MNMLIMNEHVNEIKGTKSGYSCPCGSADGRADRTSSRAYRPELRAGRVIDRINNRIINGRIEQLFK